MNDVRRLWPYVSRRLGRLSSSLTLLVIAGALEVLTTSLAIFLFDDVLAPSGGIDERFAFIPELLERLPGGSVTQLALALLILTLFKGLCLYYCNLLMSQVGQKVVMELRNDLYGHVIRQSLSFFTTNSTGRLMSRMNSDVEQVQEAVSTTLAELCRETVLLIFLVGWVFYIDWRLAGLAMGIAPFAFLLTLVLGRRIRRASWRSRDALANLNDSLQQTLTGIRMVKAFGMETTEETRFKNSSDHLLRTNLRAFKILFLSSPAMEFLGVTFFIPLLYYAHHGISAGALTLGVFSGSLFSLFRMYDPIRKLSRIHIQFQRAFASTGRIFELMETQMGIPDLPHARALEGLGKSIEFENVHFNYHDASGKTRVLSDIHFRVRRGEVIALVGSSGAGKSTLVSLIPRFYDVSSGSIKIDESDVRDFTQQSLRRNIAVVSQESFLFNDTIHNNIAYGDIHASPQQILDAAKTAMAHDFIQRLPSKYDTVIGERGQRLSGGERQRISIARAILRNAPILILDEATSSLDSESEKLVQTALANLIRDRTTFVIAHRLSTVRRANLILVLKEGRICESGSHDELMKMEGLYCRFFRLQHEEVLATESRLP